MFEGFRIELRVVSRYVRVRVRIRIRARVRIRIRVRIRVRVLSKSRHFQLTRYNQDKTQWAVDCCVRKKRDREERRNK